MPSDSLHDVPTSELMSRYRAIMERAEEADQVPEERATFAELDSPETRQRAREIEEELDKRGIKYRKIQW